MTVLVLFQAALLLAGTVFFLIGTLGLLKMRDSYSRTHALTKVDNVGLGLIVLGLLPQVSLAAALKLLLIWLLALAASATVGHLIANARHRRETGKTLPAGEQAPDRGGMPCD